MPMWVCNLIVTEFRIDVDSQHFAKIPVMERGGNYCQTMNHYLYEYGITR